MDYIQLVDNYRLPLLLRRDNGSITTYVPLRDTDEELWIDNWYFEHEYLLFNQPGYNKYRGIPKSKLQQIKDDNVTYWDTQIKRMRELLENSKMPTSRIKSALVSHEMTASLPGAAMILSYAVQQDAYKGSRKHIPLIAGITPFVLHLGIQMVHVLNTGSDVKQLAKQLLADTSQFVLLDALRAYIKVTLMREDDWTLDLITYNDLYTLISKN